MNIDTIENLLRSFSKDQLKVVCNDMNFSSTRTKNNIIKRLLAPLKTNFKMSNAGETKNLSFN